MVYLVCAAYVWSMLEMSTADFDRHFIASQMSWRLFNAAARMLGCPSLWQQQYQEQQQPFRWLYSTATRSRVQRFGLWTFRIAHAYEKTCKISRNFILSNTQTTECEPFQSHWHWGAIRAFVRKYAIEMLNK